MASITIEASKVARKSPIRVDSSLVGTVSGVEDVSVSLPSVSYTHLTLPTKLEV